MEAQVNWQNIHPTVREVLTKAKVSGVTGEVSNVSNGRVEVTFTHDNDGNETAQSFWFDPDCVKVFDDSTWLD